MDCAAPDGALLLLWARAGPAVTMVTAPRADSKGRLPVKSTPIPMLPCACVHVDVDMIDDRCRYVIDFISI